MRLLDVHTKELHTFYGEDIPPYAILSHTWGKDHEEVTFQQLHDVENRSKILGWQKIEYTCDEAARQGFRYAWIDTCCIDKTSSSELSEAINSMFAWYKSASVCYAYLIDVAEGGDYLSSRWWSRAWTLQELLAPVSLEFYSNSWIYLGNKIEHLGDISEKTGIDLLVIKDPSAIATRCVAQKMSWASKRTATRVEDMAYSLLGIFEINMPLLYGEGKSAFMRLQHEILNTVADQTLFAWGFSSHAPYHDSTFNQQSESVDHEPTWPDLLGILKLEYFTSGIFAETPEAFEDCGDLRTNTQHMFASQIVHAHSSVQIDLPLFRGVPADVIPGSFPFDQLALLACVHARRPHFLVGIILRRWKDNRFIRLGLNHKISTFLVHPREARGVSQERLWVDQHIRKIRATTDRGKLRSIVIDFRAKSGDRYELCEVSSGWEWDKENSTLYELENTVFNEQVLRYFCKEKGFNLFFHFQISWYSTPAKLKFTRSFRLPRSRGDARKKYTIHPKAAFCDSRFSRIPLQTNATFQTLFDYHTICELTINAQC